MAKPVNPAALLVLLSGAVCIAFAPIFVRLSEIGPIATAFYRLALSLPLFWAWLGWQRHSVTPPRGPACAADYRLLFLAGFFFACDLSFWHWSIRLTSVANATLLANFAPIFVTLGSWLIFRERFSVKFLTGMCCAITGVIILLGASVSISPQHVIGDLLGVTTAVFYGAYILTIGRLRRRFSTVTIMAWSGAGGSVALLIVTLISGESLLPPTLTGWLVLIGLALVSQTAGQSLIAWALAHLSAAFGSVTLLLQPVIAALIAWLLFAESLGLLQSVGGCVVLAGVFLARRGV